MFQRKKFGWADRAIVRVLFAIFFSVALVCVVAGVGLGIRKVLFVARASKATGVVTGHYVTHEGADKALPMAIFVFTNAVGQAHTITQRVASALHPFPVGSAVDVLYSAKNSSKAEIGQFSLIFFGPVALGVCGMLLLGSIVLWRFLFRALGGI